MVGGALPAFTYTVSGVLTGETAITGTPLLSSPTANLSVEGSYAIEVDLTGVTPTANYAFDATSSVAGTLRVEAITPYIVPVTGVSLNTIYRELGVNETYRLTTSVYPSSATNQGVRWSTSDPNVATVSEGTVTGMANGTATITVTTDDGGYTASCEFIVGNNTVGIEQASAGVYVTLSQSTLFVTSPSAESIALYSFNGQLLFLDKKPVGSATFTMGNRLNEKLIIAKGSAGWVRIIIVTQ